MIVKTKISIALFLTNI